MEFKGRLHSVLFKIDVFMVAQSIILGGLIAICALGVHIAATDLGLQLSAYQTELCPA
jgi:hypothetical protein